MTAQLQNQASCTTCVNAVYKEVILDVYISDLHPCIRLECFRASCVRSRLNARIEKGISRIK